METDANHFLACGLLMFPSVWKHLVGRRYRCAFARIHGFRRRKIAGSDNPVLIGGCLSESVSGTLYYAVDSVDLRRVDRFEGKRARPTQVACTLDSGRLVPARVYILQERHRHLLSEEKWDPQRFLREWLTETSSEPTTGEMDFLKRGAMGFCDRLPSGTGTENAIDAVETNEKGDNA
jgi:hypothetical protein